MTPPSQTHDLVTDGRLLSRTGPMQRDSDWGGQARTAADDVAWAARRAAMTMAAATLEACGGDTGRSDAVMQICGSMADELGIYGEHRAELLAAAQLHDIGTVALPDALLDKPGALDDREWALVHEHTAVGERIIRSLPELDEVARCVRHSHERWDGGGYPDGLSGEQIPLASRIVFCADAFHAIQSDRPYRRARTPQAALDEVRRGAGTQFDPHVVDALVKAAGKHPVVLPRVVSADLTSGHDTRRNPGLVARVGARIASRVNAAMFELLFLLGLGGVFLANAAVAIVDPAPFQAMVAASPMGSLMGDGALVAPMIAVNDSLIGLAIIAAFRVRKLHAPVLAWAGVWLLIVTLLKITTMG